MRSISIWAIAAALWALCILVLSVIPMDDLPELHIWEPDKLVHAAFYLILSYLLFRAVLPGRQKNNAIRSSVLVCIFYGFIIECIQYLLPTRQFDLFDVLANMLGCALAMLFVRMARFNRI